MEEAEILVSGATGRTGGSAIDQLVKMGKRVRADGIESGSDGRRHSTRGGVRTKR